MKPSIILFLVILLAKVTYCQFNYTPKDSLRLLKTEFGKKIKLTRCSSCFYRKFSDSSVILIKGFDKTLLNKKMLLHSDVNTHEKNIDLQAGSPTFGMEKAGGRPTTSTSVTYNIEFEGTQTYVSFDNLLVLESYFRQYPQSKRKYKTYKRSIYAASSSVMLFLTGGVLGIVGLSKEKKALATTGGALFGVGTLGMYISLPLYTRGLNRAIESYNNNVE
ncbi:MAG: hypothetical protein N4A35_13885 [Flavobacteriales bacterium]|jgi:hypothetical protein|nr:hypothetical protein [Flavobacteriales bacterium]